MKSQPGNGNLLPIGGAENKTAQSPILTRFVQMCGGRDAQLVVIPSASGFAAETGDAYCRLFSAMGVRQVECLHIRERSEANLSRNVSLLHDADGIFLTGGDQLKLTTLLAGTGMAVGLQESLASGRHIAGTSAGASAMSRQMIAFGRSGHQPSQRMVQLASGLGLADSLIIDQHFTQRNRLGRLMTAVALNPGMIGVGIDEDTALLIQPDGGYEVIGSGTVTVVDGRALEYTDIYKARRYESVVVDGVSVQTYSAGEFIHLPYAPDEAIRTIA